MQQGDSILIAEPLSASPYISGPAYWASSRGIHRCCVGEQSCQSWASAPSIVGGKVSHLELLKSMVGYVVTARNAVPATILFLLLPKRDLRFPPFCTRHRAWFVKNK